MASSEKTIIVSSHILQDVERICDYALIVSNGKLVRSGQMKTLLAGEEGSLHVQANRIAASADPDTTYEYRSATIAAAPLHYHPIEHLITPGKLGVTAAFRWRVHRGQFLTLHLARPKLTAWPVPCVWSMPVRSIT